MILQTNPGSSYRAHQTEIDEAVARVLKSGWYVLGAEVEAFESEFAEFVGVEHAVGVASGTDGIELILRSLGMGRGDVVITVSHTAVATVAGVELAEVTPVLMDIDAKTFNLDVDRLEATIQQVQADPELGTLKGIMPVHLYGRPVDMPALMEIADRYDLLVIEDCSQAHGATVGGRVTGSWGHAAAYSLYPTKNLGAIGDAGVAVTGDAALAAEMKSLRQYGWKERYISAEPGMNSRLDPLQAAILRVKLRHLAQENSRRAEIAQMYREGIDREAFVHPTVPENATHVYHQYVLRTTQRDAFRAFLKERGVGTLVHYPAPVHLQPAYCDRLSIGAGGMVATEKIAPEIVSLPIYPHLTDAEVERVCDTIAAWTASIAA
ncbi:MAG: DegT/DnrJ/EryC1/StrS family aminotransferase [Geitlerinemataceae cyanobacterium]